MPQYTQANRPMEVFTPLDPDALLLVGFHGQEAISQLFSFQLDLLAENKTQIAFDKLLGQRITIGLSLPDGKGRYFNGICSGVGQGMRDQTFTSYRMEIVPEFWLLTRQSQSRIFQHKSVPDILREVFGRLNVSFEIQGTFPPRDYCVQYRETDFNFASRLMEEEGIYYFFKHTAEGHQMIVANTTVGHPNIPNPREIIFEEVEGGIREEERIYRWQKLQKLRSGTYTLWDHSFELPHKHLEAQNMVTRDLKVGAVDHKLAAGGSDQFEIYDYPGGYAKRFAGIDKAGGEQAAELQKIFEDNRRTARIRIEQEAVPGLVIEADSNCRHLVSGHRFKLKRHFNADGEYVLTSMTHVAKLSVDYRSGESGEFEYYNSFTCIPYAPQLPFRPQQVTPKPVIAGTQTAVVVGPPGEEIFVDKYGRVKVQFHWDRYGYYDADSSCWVRVAQSWAGKRWGTLFLPRIGMEVIVEFIEGDPDRPIITGCVYNATEMPHYSLPDNKTMSYVKSYSSKGGQGFNEIRLEDKKGREQIFIHAERNKDIRIENDRFETVSHDSHFIVTNDQLEQVGGDKHLHVKGDQNEKVDGAVSLTAGSDMQEKVGQKYALDAGMEIHLKSGTNLVIETGTSLTLKVGSNFININSAGVFITGTMVMINSGGAAGPGSGSRPESPKDPKEADKAEFGEKSEPPQPGPPPTAGTYSPAALIMQQAAQDGTPFCDI